MARPARRPRRQAQGPRLRLIRGVIAGLLATACANPGNPPGGPPDTAPPAILAVRPDSGSIIPDLAGDAVIQFDEVIDEMAGGYGAGGGGLERQVVLSPVAGPVKVTWHRSAIHIRPKEGWKPGRVYRLELRPGIIDLRRNTLPQGRTILFSTGPALPSARLEGSAVLWVEQRALPLALIQAVPLPDTIAYVTLADSTGHFRLDGIPAGRYVVYAVHDQNGNRQRDRREAYDSVAVTIDSAAAAALWAFVHDTTGPRLRTADPVDSVTTRLTFAQPLDPAVLVDPSRVRVRALPDSTPVPVSAVMTVAQHDSLVARSRAESDSARRAADTTARRDTVPAPAAAGPPPAAQRAPAVGGAPAAADTSALKRLLRTRPVPSDKLVIRVGQWFAAGQKYFIEVTGAQNLNGARADGQAVLTVPAVRDSTRAPRDSTP